jgi:metal-dependent amidase/aminoacylase/carboxypeptidase family protein
MVTSLQTMVTRQFNVLDPVVVTVGSFDAGTRRNIIPAEAAFEAHRSLVLARDASAGLF